MIELTYEAVKRASETARVESRVLRDVLERLAHDHTCLGSSGFEGPDTFPACGECIVCIAQKIFNVDPNMR